MNLYKKDKIHKSAKFRSNKRKQCHVIFVLYYFPSFAHSSGQHYTFRKLHISILHPNRIVEIKVILRFDQTVMHPHTRGKAHVQKISFFEHSTCNCNEKKPYCLELIKSVVVSFLELSPAIM